MSTAFTTHLVVHFEDQVARVTPAQLAADCGVSVDEVEQTVTVLLGLGFLRARDDGTFDAAIPGEAS